jgi:hypothetical protein
MALKRGVRQSTGFAKIKARVALFHIVGGRAARNVG